jgi:hypothetical protein
MKESNIPGDRRLCSFPESVYPRQSDFISRHEATKRACPRKTAAPGSPALPQRIRRSRTAHCVRPVSPTFGETDGARPSAMPVKSSSVNQNAAGFVSRSNIHRKLDGTLQQCEKLGFSVMTCILLCKFFCPVAINGAVENFPCCAAHGLRGRLVRSQVDSAA